MDVGWVMVVEWDCVVEGWGVSGNSMACFALHCIFMRLRGLSDVVMSRDMLGNFIVSRPSSIYSPMRCWLSGTMSIVSYPYS